MGKNRRAGAGGQIWLISTAASSLLFFTQITQKYLTFRFLHCRCLWTVTERPLDHGMSYISWKLWPIAFRLRFPKWICPRCIFAKCARITHLQIFAILFPQTPLFLLKFTLIYNQYLVLNSDSGRAGEMGMTPDFWRFAKLPRWTVLWLIQPGIPFSPHPKPSGTCKPTPTTLKERVIRLAIFRIVLPSAFLGDTNTQKYTLLLLWSLSGQIWLFNQNIV